MADIQRFTSKCVEQDKAFCQMRFQRASGRCEEAARQQSYPLQADCLKCEK